MYYKNIVPAVALSASFSHAFTWQQLRGHPLIGSYFGMPGTDATYDYIIVGGGTAGLTIATRLAENRSLSIAVVEAGSFYEISNGNQSTIPYYSMDSESADPHTFVNKWIDWDVVTVPQPQLGGSRLHYAQGKILGGSSGRNQMIYQRGSRGSYDYWAELVGDDSYRWDSMLPYFKRSPHFTAPNVATRGANSTVAYDAGAYSPSGGPLQVSYPNFRMPFSPYGIRALEAIGYPSGDGFESGVLNSVGYNVSTACHCRRLGRLC